MRWEFVFAHCRSPAVLSCSFLVCRWSSAGLSRPALPSRKVGIWRFSRWRCPPLPAPVRSRPVILLTDNDVYSVHEQAETAVVLVIVLALNYLLLLLSDVILRIIGRPGAAILTRVMGIILTALSVQFVLT